MGANKNKQWMKRNRLKKIKYNKQKKLYSNSKGYLMNVLSYDFIENETIVT